MYLLDESVDNIPKHNCPKCKEQTLFEQSNGTLFCDACGMLLTKGGFVKGFSLRVAHKKWKREQGLLKK